MKLKNPFKRSYTPQIVQTIDENYALEIEKRQLDMGGNMNFQKNYANEGEELKKAYNNKEISYVAPAVSLGAIDVVGGQRYRQRRGTGKGSYRNNNKTLKYASENIIVNAIITTRANQVSAFAQPARLNPTGVGFEVTLRDEPEDTTDVRKADLKRIREIEDFIDNLGSEQKPDRNFRLWAKQVVRDTLIYDQTNSEIVYDKNKKPVSFRAIDASTVFYASDKNGQPIKDSAKAIKYVQVADEGHAVGFREGELTFNMMNPRTDIYAYKYGLSPLEVSLNEVNYHEMTEEFNAKYFAQGGTTMGVLNIKTGGQQTMAALDDFRRDWANNFGGLNGAWKIPVVAADDVKYINMNQSSKDMEFEKWLNYLIKVLSANFQIDAGELGFQIKNATGGGGNSLQEASKAEGVQLSQDKGLRPILEFIEDIINSNLMPNFYGGKYVFRFKGDGISREMQLINKIKEEVTTYKTLNEVRIENGLPPIEVGDLPLNAIAIQRQGQINQEAQLKIQNEINAKQLEISQEEAKQESDEPLNRHANSGEDDSKGVSDQDIQSGLDGSQSTKDAGVKKDGQLRNQDTANHNAQAGTNK